MVDLDLLSLFPLEGGKNHGGMERRQALKRSTMEERESAKSWGRVKATIGEESPLNRLPQENQPLGADSRRGGTTAPRVSADQQLENEPALAVLPLERNRGAKRR